MAAALLLAVGAAPYAPAQSGPAVPPPPAGKPPAPAPLPPFRLPTTTTETVPSGVDARACQGSFVEHLLEHSTAPGDERIGLYASYGAGVGIGDLDGDGDLEVVLANLDGPNTVHWNEGGLRFRVQSLPVEASRAVHLIDADGDGRLDLFFTHPASVPTLWLNAGAAGGAEFVRADAGIREPLYTADWADFDADGDLDLVGATYDAELYSTAPGATGGVFVYRNGGDPGAAGGLLRLDARLATRSQALAVLAADLDGDGRIDVTVGNDSFLPDYQWLRSDDGWRPGSLFGRTAHNTTSLVAGDVDNDGHVDLLATDRKPYAADAESRSAWEPLHLPPPPDPAQVDRNVLQLARGGAFHERGVEWGIDASGWSWSSKFGDLDHDGFLDAYVVNGMIAVELFEHLPGGDLVEENQAFRNMQGTPLRSRPGVGAGRAGERPRHEHGRPGRRRRPGHRHQQPGDARAAVREPAVRRRPPANRPALAGRRQPLRRRRTGPPGHLDRQLHAYRASGERVSVRRHPTPALRRPTGQPAAGGAHRLARRRAVSPSGSTRESPDHRDPPHRPGRRLTPFQDLLVDRDVLSRHVS